jgi:hypothetical protein
VTLAVAPEQLTLNGPLATFYGLPGPSDDTFALTQLDPQRYAGLLTQPAFLASGSYSRPSPTRRGRAISQGLLCTLIPDEPPDLTGIGPEPIPVPEPMTTRQALEQHRSQPVCVPCHVLMDPLGFALENFDTVGYYRAVDPDTGGAVDTSGELPDGTKITGPDDLRAALLARPEHFVQTLTEQLMTYALGRPLDHRDMPVVRDIVRKAAADDYRFATIASLVVASDAFRRREAARPAATVAAATTGAGAMAPGTSDVSTLSAGE